MKTIETMTKEERSLLLFLETRAVDCAGKVSIVHMNAADMKTVEQWNREGFVRFGRIASEYLSERGNHWCHLSDEAWRLAGSERMARAGRTWSQRTWKTTQEKSQLEVAA